MKEAIRMSKNAHTPINGRLITHHRFVGVLQEIPLRHIPDSAIHPPSIPRLYTAVINPASAIGQIYLIAVLSLVSSAIPEINTNGY